MVAICSERLCRVCLISYSISPADDHCGNNVAHGSARRRDGTAPVGPKAADLLCNVTRRICRRKERVLAYIQTMSRNISPFSSLCHGILLVCLSSLEDEEGYRFLRFPQWLGQLFGGLVALTDPGREIWKMSNNICHSCLKP